MHCIGSIAPRLCDPISRALMKIQEDVIYTEEQLRAVLLERAMGAEEVDVAEVRSVVEKILRYTDVANKASSRRSGPPSHFRIPPWGRSKR